MPVVEHLSKAIDESEQLYFRLILLVSQSREASSTALLELSLIRQIPIVNINAELGKALLEHPSKTRPLRVPEELDAILKKHPGAAIALDAVEILFDCSLHQDPLRRLQLLSRNRTIIAAWPGTAAGRTLTYGGSSHPEFRTYSDVDAMIVLNDQHPNGAGA